MVVKYAVLQLLVALVVSTMPAQAEIFVGLAGPMTGSRAWSGQQFQRGAELAIADINAAGGVLGQQLKLVVVDDANDRRQAIAVANKLVFDGVSLIVGHRSSDMTRAVSNIYAAANIIQITPSATNPELTERGIRTLFRVCGRDDQQAIFAGNYLKQFWANKSIGIIHDNSSYGLGLARATQKQLNAGGVTEVLFRGFKADELDYGNLLKDVKNSGVDVLYIGAYSAEAGLIVRQARDAKMNFQLVSGDALHNSDFWQIAGDAGMNSMFTFDIDPRTRPEAQNIVQRFRADGYEPEGYTIHTYAAIQVWADAVDKANTLNHDEIAKVMHKNYFDTVLGNISFNEKGDLSTHDYAWYSWQQGKPVRQ
jgi:branched-chain amino acid transport system substrate-binding protein